MIECTTLHGKKKLVEADSLIMRPAAYGIIQHENKVLLVNTRSTGRWSLPGGAIEKGEKSEDALRREIKEETGIDVKIEKLFKFEESFFYYDPWEKGFHNFTLVYLCKPLTFELSDSENEERDEAENPQWVDMESLRPPDFQEFVAGVMDEFIKSNLDL